jgi:catechol 2,3-dioxygenase-like lactoylglutathione lyase family enzyme
MLSSVQTSAIYVFDQDEAIDFYVDKLGLELRTDYDLGLMRYITVAVPGQEDRQIVLERPGPPVMDEATAEQVREVVSKGAGGGWIGFTTDDCRATYEELVARGVEFFQEPTEQFYGTDCALRDPFGNALRILQPISQQEFERRLAMRDELSP